METDRNRVTCSARQCLVWCSILVCSIFFVDPSSAQTNFVVAADGSGQYKTVQEAINAVPQNTRFDNPAIIHIKPGTYKELIYVQHEKRFVHLVGEDAEKTVITYNLNANMIGTDGKII